MSHIADALKEKGHDVTVICMDNDHGRRYCAKLFDDKNIPYILTEGPDMSVALEVLPAPQDPLENFINLWRPHCIKACKELKPDLIVCDVWSRYGAIAADEMGIPSVINSPLPLTLFKDIGII